MPCICLVYFSFARKSCLSLTFVRAVCLILDGYHLALLPCMADDPSVEAICPSSSLDFLSFSLSVYNLFSLILATHDDGLQISRIDQKAGPDQVHTIILYALTTAADSVIASATKLFASGSPASNVGSPSTRTSSAAPLRYSRRSSRSTARSLSTVTKLRSVASAKRLSIRLLRTLPTASNVVRIYTTVASSNGSGVRQLPANQALFARFRNARCVAPTGRPSL